MPRASIDLKKPYAFQLFTTVNIKKYIPDVIPDIRTIFQMQLDRFSDFLYENSYDELSDHIENLNKADIKQCTKNRIYIVTNLDYIPFTIVDLDEAVVDNLIHVYSVLNIRQSDDLTPDLVSTLFVFKDESLCYTSDIRPHDIAQLMAVFKNENLVDFSGARYDYYGKPRREARKN